MRKGIITLIILILCTTFCPSYAEGVTTYQITMMEMISDSENVTVADLRFTQNGEKVSVWGDFISSSDSALLVEFFSNDNLLYSGEADEEALAGNGIPEEGEVYLCIESEFDAYITFDNERVLVEIIDVDGYKLYCGFFTYRNENGYNELMKLLEEIYSRAKPLLDEKREEEKQKAEAEKIYLEDFESLYSCEVPDVTEWGICSYTKENEKKYAVYSVYYDFGNKVKPLYFTEEKPVNNKVSFYYDKQIYTGGEKTYIRENVHPTTTYEIEVFPNENGKVNKVVITQVVTTTGRVLKSTTADENLIQTGKIPDGFFTVSAENDTKEEENLPEEEKKPVEEEEEEMQEDTEEEVNEEITTDDKKEENVQNQESEIKKKAEESGLVLTIGEKEALVKGERKENDVPPIIRNSRTMLPARFVGEGLGAFVEWSGEKREVTVRKGDIVIRIYIDSDRAYVNNREEKLDAPAFIENDRTYIPLRFIAENFGADIIWEPDARMVFIAEKG